MVAKFGKMSYGMNEWVRFQPPIEQEIDIIFMELPHMKRHDFSLVELLVVIGIIGLLAGLLLPAVSSGRQKGMITQAKADMNSIRMALKNVETNYGQMVKMDNGKADFNGKSVSKKSETVDSNTIDEIILGNIDLGGSDSVDAYNAFIRELSVPQELDTDEKNINKRNIKFLDPRPEYDEDAVETIWRDPWGTPYTILINVNYTDKVYIPIESTKVRSGATAANIKSNNWLLSGNAFLYSWGPNGEDDRGLNQNNVGDNTTDDICSWEK